MGRRSVATNKPDPAQAQPAEAAASEPISKQARGKKAAAAKQAAGQQDAAAAAAASKGTRSRKRPHAAAAAAGEDTSQPAAKPKPSKAPRPPAAAAATNKPVCYLVKSEPAEFSVDDLKSRPDQTEGWEGVRNAAARNFLRGMAVGDLAFFYHSSCKVPGIVGIVKVVREAYPDATAFDSNSKYHDPKSSPDNPKWFQVDFQLVRRLRRQISLEELKQHKDADLAGMALFNRPRLSVQPVTKAEWDFVLSLEEAGEQGDA